MLPLAFTVLTVLAGVAPSLQQSANPTVLASQFSLPTSTTLPFPTETLANSDAHSFIVNGWSLSKGKIQQGGSNIAFVDDPFPNKPAPSSSSSTGPVLQVTYPAGGFGSESSGMQLYSLWNTSDGSSFQSMIVTYEVAFDADFDFNKGGKLPGLRGGPDPDGCSGGSAANGTNCFSTRLMWRKQGAGEVYAYIPMPNNICSNKDFRCNDDGFGTSIDRSSFTFSTGGWNRITVLVRLNQPLNIVNGQVSLYFNDVRALDEQALQYRNNRDITIGGLYFSTFFGGSDSSWAPTKETHAYFRNIQLFGGSAPSDLKGEKSNGASPSQPAWFVTLVLGATAFALANALSAMIS